MMIQNQGRVGIGTTSPGVELHIKDSVPRLRLEAEGTGAAANAYIEFNETDARKAWIGFGSTSNNDLTIYQENTDSDVVIPRGNVGIGTTSPDAKLDIRDSSGTSEIQLQDRTLAYRHAYKTLSTEEGGSWYRIAEKGTGRASARFAVNEVQSGKHSTAAFYASSFYSNNNYWNSSLSLLNRSIHSGNSCIRKVRIVTGDATYDPAYVEIFVYNNATNTNDCRASFSIYDNEHNEGWYPVDFLEVPEDAESPEYEALSPGQHSDNAQPYYYSDSVLDFTGTPIMAVANKTGDIFRAAANGTVGIGTTAPTARLHVESSNREDSINRVCPAGTLWASFFDGNADHDWNGDSILDGRDYGALDGIDTNDYLEDNECVVFGTSTGNEAGATPGDEEFWVDTDLDRAVDAGEIITGATTTLDGDAVVAASPNRCEDGYVWLSQGVDAGDEPVAGECIAPQLDENSDILRVDFTGESCPTGTQQRDENEDGNTDDGECHIPALFVQSNGNVGIGTTEPTIGSKLDVRGNASVGLYGKWGIRDNNGGTEFVIEHHNGDGWNDADIKMTVNSSGNVGIGTTSPTSDLHVKGSSSAISIENTYTNDDGTVTGRRWGLYSTGGNSSVGGEKFAIMDWSDTSSSADSDKARLVVDKNGNVGIGTTDPGSYKLHVNGTAYATGAAGALSDSRHKNTVTDLGYGLAEILKLRPVSFLWNTDKVADSGMEGIQLGFIAQEVEKVLPEVIMTQDDEANTKAMKYSALISPLVQAIKELHALYQGHADRLAALEAQNAEQDNHIAHQDERIAHQDELIVQLEEQNVGLLKTVVQLEVRLAALEAAQ